MDSDELTCPNCGSTEGPRGTKQDRDVIELVCDDCSHTWTRVPRQPCPRCGSGDIETGGYEGWAFEDVEQARDDTMAEWHFVDQATFRCRKCRHEWKTGRRIEGAAAAVDNHSLSTGERLSVASWPPSWIWTR